MPCHENLSKGKKLTWLSWLIHYHRMVTDFLKHIDYRAQTILNRSRYGGGSGGGGSTTNLLVKYRRNRTKCWLIVSGFVVLILYILGVFVHPFELDFETSFEYPLHLEDFRYFIESAKLGIENVALNAINNYSYGYHMNPRLKCDSNHSLYPVSLLLVVKSATCNFVLRNVIRQTWGYEKRFSDVNIKTVFMLGECPSGEFRCENEFHQHADIIFSKNLNRLRSMAGQNKTVRCQEVIEMESSLFGDIVQANFLDVYYNNTQKTLATLQWTAKHCSNVPFIFFVDDDYYVSMKNLLKFVRGLWKHVETASQDLTVQDNHGDQQQKRQNNGVEVDRLQMLTGYGYDGRLYAGYVFPHSRPQRHVIGKWFVNLSEYPYDRYPPYVTGGCFLVNNRTAVDLYYASLFTKPFKYDDVYLGILAKKMQIHLIDNNRQMHFYKLAYDRDGYRRVVSSHGYQDPSELWQVWNEQRSLGNA